MPISKLCESCGKIVTRPSSHMTGRIYCCRECSYIKENRDTPHKKHCEYCSTEMIKQPKDTWQYWKTKKFCNHECYSKNITGKSNIKVSNTFKKMWAENEAFIAKMKNRPSHSQQTRMKISLAGRGRVLTEEHKRKLSVAFTGEKHPQFGKKMKPESVEKMRNSKKGKPISTEFKKRLSALFTGRRLSTETRNKLSIITKNQWKNEESRMRLLQGLAKSQEGSTLEDKVVTILDLLKIEYSRQVPISRCIVDFYLPSINGVLHVDGEYWHYRLPEQMEKNRKVDSLLKSMGYKTLRLRELIIKNEPQLVIEMIKGFCKLEHC